MPAKIKPRRFPPPWTFEETDPCFIVRDDSSQRSLMFISRMTWSGSEA